MAVAEYKNLTVLKKKGTLLGVPFRSIKEKVLGSDYELSIVFVGPKTAKQLNIDHRNRDYIPDTLAFPLSKNSGEIIMCESVMRKAYKKSGYDFIKYVKFMLIHSMLHLKGYSHGSTMERKEKQILKLFT